MRECTSAFFKLSVRGINIMPFTDWAHNAYSNQTQTHHAQSVKGKGWVVEVGLFPLFLIEIAFQWSTQDYPV